MKKEDFIHQIEECLERLDEVSINEDYVSFEDWADYLMRIRYKEYSDD